MVINLHNVHLHLITLYKSNRMPEQNREAIPADVARELRQEAGFGCVVCGNPIIEYHHIIRWEEEHHFRPADMVCFCPNHHAGVKILTVDEEREYKAHPHNIVKGLAEGMLTFKQGKLAVVMGNNLLTGNDEGTILSVDGEPIISIFLNDKGRLEISAIIYDKTGQRVAVIDKNQWMFGSQDLWDFEFEQDGLTMRSNHYKVLLNISSKTTPIEIKGSFWNKGVGYEVSPSKITFHGYNGNKVKMDNVAVGSINLNSNANEIIFTNFKMG
jgi:hypothetical protein